MTVSEIMQSYSVTVNGGSGVLVDAMTQDYSYVLTAAHVLLSNPEDIVVSDYQGIRLRVLSVLTPQEWVESQSDRHDFAVLKIDYLERISQKCLPASDLLDRASLTLVGFPATERNSSDPIKQYTGHKISVVDELVMISLDGIPGTETIRGMSGGGVYHTQDGKPLLIGVEFKMDGSTSDQQYGRAQCHSLAKFENLIIEHSSAPLIPPYLECFSNMKDEIFAFNVIEPESVSSLKQELKNAADYLINNGLIPPYKLMEQYNSDLLVEPKSLGELKSYELWVSYLEFLVISVLIDRSANADNRYLKALERKRRLIYTSNSTNWISRLEELLITARRLLDKDGTLIVASPEATAKVLPPSARLERIISNISVVPTQGPFQVIDSVDSFESQMLTSYKLTHLEGLRNTCVVDIEEEYSSIPEDRYPSELLREKLSEIIN
jgi:hypothetical protein